jgi:hypothetical protein
MPPMMIPMMPGSFSFSDSSGVIKMIAMMMRKKPTGFSKSSRSMGEETFWRMKEERIESESGKWIVSQQIADR